MNIKNELCYQIKNSVCQAMASNIGSHLDKGDLGLSRRGRDQYDIMLKI